MLKLMKWIGILLSGIVILSVVVSKDEPLQAGHQATSAEQEDLVKNLIASEPKVKDAFWSTDSTLLIGVIDDKTRRDGLASYFCEVLRERGITDKYLEIRIIDIVKVVNDNNRVVLGQKRCN